MGKMEEKEIEIHTDDWNNQTERAFVSEEGSACDSSPGQEQPPRSVCQCGCVEMLGEQHRRLYLTQVGLF